MSKKRQSQSSELKLEDAQALFQEFGEFVKDLPQKLDPKMPHDEMDMISDRWKLLCDHLKDFPDRFAKGADLLLREFKDTK